MSNENKKNRAQDKSLTKGVDLELNFLLAEVEGRLREPSDELVRDTFASIESQIQEFESRQTDLPANTSYADPLAVARKIKSWIDVKIDTAAAWFPDPGEASAIGGMAHVKRRRAEGALKAPYEWQRVGGVPSVLSDVCSFELWERGREREVRIVPGSALGNVVVHQVLMPALVSSRDPAAFPVVVKSEEGQDPRLVVEGLKSSRLKNLKEAIEEAQAAGDEDEVARLLPRLGLEAK
ncbi:hypothetical protein ACERZ8_03550 [Tateyamaria armeniaca]|uniref:Uncharacterized protein n=1 Tax=Tateyamaria armeniaca TaxID=2518930 RepID=A0ABW8UPD5_9RHOB